MWFFNSNKQIIFSTSYRLWLIRRKAFYWDCIPRSISINDTTIVRNFYPKKLYPWCKSKKLYNLSMASKKTDISPTCLQKFLPSPAFPSKNFKTSQKILHQQKPSQYFTAHMAMKLTRDQLPRHVGIFSSIVHLSSNYCETYKTVNTRIIYEILSWCKERANQMREN